MPVAYFSQPIRIIDATWAIFAYFLYHMRKLVFTTWASWFFFPIPHVQSHMSKNVAHVVYVWKSALKFRFFKLKLLITFDLVVEDTWRPDLVSAHFACYYARFWAPKLLFEKKKLRTFLNLRPDERSFLTIVTFSGFPPRDQQ